MATIDLTAYVIGKTGEWCVGLPIPASQSPGAIPAYHLKEIITSKGVYTYDDRKQDYDYKPHTQVAAEARAARDEYWRKVDEKEYQEALKIFLATKILDREIPFARAVDMSFVRKAQQKPA